MDEKNSKQKATEIVVNHLEMLATIPVEKLIDNPALLYVVNEGIKNCSLTLMLISRIE